MQRTSAFRRILVLAIAAVLTCSCLLASDADDFAPVELSMATSFSTTHGVYPYLEQWAGMVNEATDGKVEIIIYASNTMVAAGDMHSAVVNGIVDIIQTDISYSPASFPLLSAVYLPNMGMKSSVTATHAFDEYYKSDFKETEGMEIMFTLGMTPFSILSNKPITKLEDLKGLQIRASGFALEAMSRLGASSIGMPISEVYEAAQKGTIAAICNSYETLKGWNFAEVVTYGTMAPIISTGSHYIGMNKEVWDAIPAGYQEKIKAVNGRILEAIAPLFDRLDAEGYQFGLEKKIIFSEIAPDELARWEQEFQPIIDKWIADKTALGLDARGAYERLMEIVKRNIDIYEK